MTFEENLTVLLDAELAPFSAEVAAMRAKLEELRRAFTPAPVMVQAGSTR